MLTGIDISAYQPAVDFTQVAKAGYRFCIVKASEGVGYTSAIFGKQWEGAGRAGLLRGAYHFLRVGKPLEQAERFVKLVEGVAFADLPCAIDFEGHEAAHGVQPAVLVDNCIACIERVEQLTGMVPLLYTGPSYFSLMLHGWAEQGLKPAPNAMELTRWPLWQATYTSKPEPKAMPWPKTAQGNPWTIWQHSGSGEVPGISNHCDLNRFAGTEQDLLALAGGRGGEA